MTGLAIIADRVEKTAEARALQAEQDEGANDEPQEEVDRHEAEQSSRAQRLDDVGHMRLARHHMLAVDDQHAAGHEAGAERHDQRLHAQERDANPVDDPDNDADQKRKPDRGRRAGRGGGREQVSGSGRHACDGEVDAARQHHHGLPAGHDREGRGEQNRIGGPERGDRAGPHDLDPDHESEEQQDQRIDRVLAQEAEGRAHLRSLR